MPEEVPPAGVEPGPVEAEPLREAPPEEAPPAPGPVEAVEEEAPAPAPLPAEEELPAAPAEPAVEAAPPVSEEAPEVAPPLSLFDRMRAGLSKTRTSLVKRIDALLSAGGGVDDEMLEELEEILITADFGMKTTQDLVQALEKGLARSDGSDPGALRDLLKEEIRKRLRLEAEDLDTASASPFVVMVVGVNGVGKTTTIGKLAYQFAGQGKKVVLGAGDTFRAAAADQLGIWAERAGVELVRHAEGADPAAVAFDAAKAATARGADVLILDTAGRLHTKVNLMEEMKKIHRVLGREIPGAPHEVLLVLDSTTGQNALVQARNFKETVKVSGVALTKLDGTAKGGMVVAIGNELDLPVRFVGIGEGIEDLRPFDPDMFVDALFEKD
ncbi:signal recognition particle-docking protein FtsY [uncultured Desulfuromonas sp.]|uniref:signal recognition particle-docking protein FtsY n=1 Tax=uncultured Desulfuromonas sp. TaxID=181013 RepID=UPI003442189D